MSESRVIALVLGAILIVGVLAYNAWRMRRYRASSSAPHGASVAPAAAGESHSPMSVGTEGPRREPDLGDLSTVAAVAEEPAPTESLATPIPAVADGLGDWVPSDDIAPEVDTVATLVFDRDLNVLDLEPLATSLRALRKPTLVGALRDGHWTQPLKSFRELRVGMQLSDRQGPIDTNDMAHFRQAVTRFAQAHQGRVAVEPEDEVIARAARLDRQCAETDIEVVINVMDERGEGIARPAVQRSARSFNLTEAGERYLALGNDGRPVYEMRLERLSGPATGVRVSFALDVAQVDAGHDAWAEMVATARALSAQVGGRLVDDGGQALNDAGLDALSRTIATLQQRMRGMGVPPGSRIASRLYSG